MTLSITKIAKRKRNCSYDYIVIRKDYKVVDIIGILYHNIRINNQIRKVFSIDCLKIQKWLHFTNLVIPKWFNQFIVPLTGFSFESKLFCDTIDVQREIAVRSHLNDLKNLKKKHIPFYRFKIFTRHFLKIRNSKVSNIKINVRLYNKKV